MPSKHIVNLTDRDQGRKVPTFSVPHLMAIIGTAYELAGRDFGDIFSEMDSEPFGSCILLPPVLEYQGVVAGVLNNPTTVDVRFLGDLKEHSYNADVTFFSAMKEVGDDFPDLLRTSIANLRKKGGGKLVMVNLANVREISVNVRPHDVTEEFSKNLSCAMDALKLIQIWAEKNDTVAIQEI